MNSSRLSSRRTRTSLSMFERVSASELFTADEHLEIASMLLTRPCISLSMLSTLVFILRIVSVAEMNLL